MFIFVVYKIFYGLNLSKMILNYNGTTLLKVLFVSLSAFASVILLSLLFGCNMEL